MSEILQVIWTVLIEAVPTTGKNAAQIRAAILKQVKAYKPLLATFCTSARVEAALMVHVQVGPLLSMNASPYWPLSV